MSIVVPALNEAYRLPAVIDSLKQHVDPLTTQIVIVDDGSTDDTSRLARRITEWAPHLLILRHETNRGKGAAVRTGVLASHGDIIGFVDADNATDLSALDAMAAAVTGGVGAVFGSRHVPGASVTGAPAIRGLMGLVFNHVVRVAAGTSIRDTQCGAKLFRGPAARVAFGSAILDGFAFDVEVLRLLLVMGFEVVEHPVRWHYVHGTKIKAMTPVTMLRDIARIRMSSSAPKMRYIDTTWSEDVASVADPLYAANGPRDGDPCRVLLPAREVAEVEAAADKLRVSGLSVDVGQSRTWSQLSGVSPS